MDRGNTHQRGDHRSQGGIAPGMETSNPVQYFSRRGPTRSESTFSLFLTASIGVGDMIWVAVEVKWQKMASEGVREPGCEEDADESSC